MIFWLGGSLRLSGGVGGRTLERTEKNTTPANYTITVFILAPTTPLLLNKR